MKHPQKLLSPLYLQKDCPSRLSLLPLAKHVPDEKLNNFLLPNISVGDAVA